MSDLRVPRLPRAISTFDMRRSPIGSYRPRTGFVPASNAITWVADQAMFIPLTLDHPYPLTHLWWVNGTSVGGTVEVGIYSADGTLIHSESVTTAGASQVQSVALATPKLLPPGGYYLAITYSAATAALMGASSLSALNLRLFGMLQQSSARPLPATMSGAGTVTSAFFPLFGVARMAMP